MLLVGMQQPGEGPARACRVQLHSFPPDAMCAAMHACSQNSASCWAAVYPNRQVRRVACDLTT